MARFYRDAIALCRVTGLDLDPAFARKGVLPGRTAFADPDSAFGPARQFGRGRRTARLAPRTGGAGPADESPAVLVFSPEPAKFVFALAAIDLPYICQAGGDKRFALAADEESVANKA
jgi:hypothetical protein